MTAIKEMTERQVSGSLAQVCRKLPGTMWETLTAALKDLRRVEKLKNYEVYMSDWHASWDRGGQTVCQVCLAGAVMARVLPFGQDVRPGLVPDKLGALDRLREGDVFGAIDLFYSGGKAINAAETAWRAVAESSDSRECDVEVTDYHDNREQFYKDMWSLVRLLKKARI